MSSEMANTFIDHFKSLELKPIDRLKDSYVIIPTQEGGSILNYNADTGERLLLLDGVHNQTAIVNPLIELSSSTLTMPMLAKQGSNSTEKSGFSTVLHTSPTIDIS